MKIVGIELAKDLLLIHYVENDDKIIDERIVAVRWKTNPALKKLVQAFAEVASEYVVRENKNLEKLESIDMKQLFQDLLDNEK